jgi:ornithine cyclodeaminase
MLYLDDDTVRALLTPAELVDALREALGGNIESPPRTHHRIPGSDAATMLLMPAWRAGSIGVKVLTLDPARAEQGFPSIDGLYFLMDSVSGAPLAILGARALTNARTAATSALAASYLARHDASTLLMIGTGNLAIPVLEAHLSVRSYQHIVIWGRDRMKAEALRQQLATKADVRVAKDLESAVASADVISCATSSLEPLVLGKHVRPGTHIDLIGSYKREMREADDALFRGSRVVVDTKAALIESGDLIGPCSTGLLNASAVRDLGELIREPNSGRRNREEITIFKAVGMAAADLATAEYLLASYKNSRINLSAGER